MIDSKIDSKIKSKIDSKIDRKIYNEDWKNSRWMEKSRSMKIPVNGKIPLAEKPGGNLVMRERNCLRLKSPCFMKECVFNGFLERHYKLNFPHFKGRHVEEWFNFPFKYEGICGRGIAPIY